MGGRGAGGDRTNFIGAFELADEDARVGGGYAEGFGNEGLEVGGRGGGVVVHGGLAGWWWWG